MSQTCCHPNARRCVFPQTSSHGVSQLSEKFTSPQEVTSTNLCRVKLTFTTAQSGWFLCSRPTSHARSSKHQQTSVFRRGLPTIHHTSQPIPSTVLGAEPIPDACLACLECSAKLVSDVSCDPWSARNSPLPETLPRNASRNGLS